MLFRRLAGSNGALVSKASSGVRRYTDYQGMKYPVFSKAYCYILSYAVVMWIIFAGNGTLFTKRSAYKEDVLRVWRRKLGTGYQWADAWGESRTTFFKGLPDSVE